MIVRSHVLNTNQKKWNQGIKFSFNFENVVSFEFRAQLNLDEIFYLILIVFFVSWANSNHTVADFCFWRRKLKIKPVF